MTITSTLPTHTQKRQTVRELSRKTPDSLEGQVVDHLDRVTSLQKQAPWYTDALL